MDWLRFLLAAGSLSASALPTRADLVAWWPFDADYDDRGSANELDGGPLGNPTFEAGALRFNAGDADGVEVAADPLLNVDLFTMGYRVNADGATQGNAGLERLTSRQGDTFETAIGGAGVLGGTTSPTGTTLAYYQGAWHVTHVPFPNDGWVHVVWRNTASAMELYLDGALAYSGPVMPPGRAMGALRFGLRHTDSVEGFEGLMDDAFFWDDTANALTPGDITAIATNGMAAFLGLAGDVDGDELPDEWEREHGLDPNDDGSVDAVNGAMGDPDGDGLSNLEELMRGTFPRDADSDDDGLDDGEEVALMSNPRSTDTDRDGLTDSEEVELGTRPDRADTDGDGFLDGFEAFAGSDPTDPGSVPGAEATLVVHLSFDGTLDDESGSGHHGTAVGSPVFDDDVPASIGAGQSLRFNPGDLDGVALGAAGDFNGGEFTLAYFINQDGAVQGNAGLERLTSRGGDAFETALGNAGALGGNTPNALSYHIGGVGWTQTGVTVPASGWVHVAWRNRGAGPGDLDLFIDGERAYTGRGAVPPAGVMNIGIRHNGEEGYEGLMDEFRLYSSALSDADMAALPDLGAGGGLRVLRVGLEEGGGGGGRLFNLTWTSAPGQFFDLEKAVDLSEDWTTVAAELEAAAGPAEETSASVVVAPGERQAFFRVRRTPPPALFFDDFESGAGGWTTGVIPGFEAGATNWELGAPAGGPGDAFSGSAAYGTDLDADYAINTGVWLRSPPIDFTDRGRTRLNFWYTLDVSALEGGRLNLLDGNGDLIQTLALYDGTRATGAWAQETFPLPELAGEVIIEFEFLTDTEADHGGSGWFIDDLRVE